MSYEILHSGTPLAVTRAKILRRPQTETEQLLWRKLRARRFHGIKFRRQVAIGIFIVDFFSVSEKLIVELDGSSHWKEGASEYDEYRTVFLQSKGLKVLRFSNNEVRTNLDGVLTRLYEVIFNSTSPYPSPEGEGKLHPLPSSISDEERYV